jgi:uncharacterized protein
LTRLIVASDLHGANASFLKFVALARHVGADICVVCGDWSGKFFADYNELPSGRREYFVDGRPWKQVPKHAVAGFEQEQKKIGWYFTRTESPVDQIGDESEWRSHACSRRLAQWLDHGLAFLGPSTRLVAICGNEDDEGVNNVLSQHAWPSNVSDDACEIDGLEFFGLGYSNWTPWRTPRQITEDQIGSKLKQVGTRVSNFKRAIGVIHVPPRSSGLDNARPVKESKSGSALKAGQELIPVGSQEVRRFVEEFSPLATFSGHCHTSHGVSRISTTMCFNPGSLYHRGLLAAYVVDVEGDEPLCFQRLVK